MPSTVQIVIIGLFALAIVSIMGYLIYKKMNQAPPWKPPPSTQEETDAFFNSGGVATANVDCQSMSNTQLSWIGHKGKAALPDWAGFQLQKCATYPVAFTSNTSLLSSWYSANSNAPPKGDPFLSESSSMESGTSSFIGNPVANKHIVVRGDGSLAAYTGPNTSTDSTQTPMWATPANSPGSYVLKFDANNSNAGNLCVFPKSGGDPVWCILPRITLAEASTTTTGQPTVNLQSQQQAQLVAANFKNVNDTVARFALLKDDGTFCVYRGTPGSQQGTSIVCK